MALQSWGDLFKSLEFTFDFGPESAAYEAGCLRIYNEQAEALYGRADWTFAFHTAVLTAHPQYTTGTALFTNGSRLVVGTGTAWTTTHEKMWISPGTGPPWTWVRVGRVIGGTSLALVDPWPYANAVASTYCLRHRYVQLPRDLLRTQSMTARADLQGPLGWASSEEERKMFLNEEIYGTPRLFTPAVTPQWQEGQGQPRTPDLTPTATGVNGGSLIDGHVYQYKTTWYMHDCETGSSEVVEFTATAPNLTARIANLQEAGATDGRYVRLYVSDKTVGTPFYRVGTYSNVTQIDDDGTVRDRAATYNDVNLPNFIRFYPRPQSDYTIELSYHARPRLMQKRTDYIEFPPDVATLIKWMTMYELAVKYSAPVIRAQAKESIEQILGQLERNYLNEIPNQMIRRGIRVAGDLDWPVMTKLITQS